MSVIAETIQQNLAAVREDIRTACDRAGRAVDDVRLVAVTKYAQWPWVEALQQFHRVFGENRPQQLAERRPLMPDVEWHLIGQLQRNKARLAIEHAAMIHSIDSQRLLDRVATVAEEVSPDKRVPVLLQVNVSEEASKSGFRVDELRTAFADLHGRPSVQIRGLMTMAPATDDEAVISRSFSGLQTLRDQLQDTHGVPLPELSMGMSGDFPIAIAAGATLIRVGSRLYRGLA